MGASNDKDSLKNNETQGTAFSPQPASILPKQKKRGDSSRGNFLFFRVLTSGSWVIIAVVLFFLLKALSAELFARITNRINTANSQTAPLETETPSVPPSSESTEPASSVETSESLEPPPRISAPSHPATLPAEPAQPVEPPAHALPKTVELILAPAPNGNFYAKGEINGQELIFVVDTGASVVSVPEKLQRRLNLVRGQYLRGTTANGIAGMYETRIKHLDIGPIHMKNVAAVINPNAPDETALLGMSALREVRMIQQNGRMVLQQEIPSETISDGNPSAPPPPQLKKSVKDCMGNDKVINDRVLKCMQGIEAEADTATEPQTE